LQVGAQPSPGSRTLGVLPPPVSPAPFARRGSARPLTRARGRGVIAGPGLSREQSRSDGPEFGGAGTYMTGKWSQWLAVGHWLDHGWNLPMVPWAKGVYRFRVQPNHSERAGEIIYVGRGGSHAGKETTTICSRVISFITAGMGFWTLHSGGEHFFKRSVQGVKQPPVHRLCVRDLEVSWAEDDDPMCLEAEELAKLPRPPVFNTRPPRTCRREKCMRACDVWATFEVW
jgi:hypothetical protein